MQSYQLGALKRSIGIGKESLKPGDMIRKMNDKRMKTEETKMQKSSKINNHKKLAIKGLI